jgi:hypothetical protein
MRTKLTLATLLAVALAAPAALPCGAPFGNGINVDPRQDIVVVHKNGVETYVFQPRFCGTAQEFGLILPVPGKLSAEPALSKAAVFTQLDAVSKPTIVYTTVCNSRSNGAAGGSGARIDALAADSGSTTVISSGTVGFMDYSQLEASSVDALTTWLDTNGYPYDSLAKAAFESYVTKGWLFVAFRVNQGAVPSGSTICKDLGPIKLTFPTAEPVVPTRMATARARDTTGALSYGPGFSWRVFGITAGDEQLGFGSGTNSATRTSNFSGLLAAGDVTPLDGLAVAGDRAVKLNLTFSYGSTDPDVVLAKVAAKDYREVITQVSYVQCYDGGLVDSGPVPISDAAVESIPDAANRDQGIEAPEPDATVVINPPESPGKGDAGVVVADASAGGSADARPVAHDAAGQSPTETLSKAHSGCSFAGAPAGSGFATAFAAALVMGLLRRRRR